MDDGGLGLLLKSGGSRVLISSPYHELKKLRSYHGVYTLYIYYEQKNINPTHNEKILNPPLLPIKYTNNRVDISSQHNQPH